MKRDKDEGTRCTAAGTGPVVLARAMTWEAPHRLEKCDGSGETEAVHDWMAPRKCKAPAGPRKHMPGHGGRWASTSPPFTRLTNTEIALNRGRWGREALGGKIP